MQRWLQLHVSADARPLACALLRGAPPCIYKWLPRSPKVGSSHCIAKGEALRWEQCAAQDYRQLWLNLYVHVLACISMCLRPQALFCWDGEGGGA